MTCHNPWAGPMLAFTTRQINRDHDYGGVIDNQLRAFKHAGLISLLHKEEDKDEAPLADFPTEHLTSPYDAKADLNERARSYLQVNCSHCHTFGAGGTADLELRYEAPLDQTKTLEVRPTQGTFEIYGAHILSPGDPYRSVLYYRMSKIGQGRMPHLGSALIDERGLHLIHDWIRQLPIRKDERALLARLKAMEEDAGGKKGNATERAETIRKLLSTTSGALVLAHALAENDVPAPVRQQVLTAAIAVPDTQVRDLFERFVPEEQRLKRLGSAIKPEQLLALKGNAARGKELFFKAGALQCVNCHRIAGTGSTLGPNLSEIGKKYTRVQILESILEPSKSIEPKYVAYLVETSDGKVHTGLLAEKNDREVVLRTVGDKEVRIPAGKVETMVPQSKSIMPELLLRDLTAEQAADLLEFLVSLK
jgi:putative heme-binding domain-containing protein